VLRGGSWINNARNCRSAQRNANDPDNRNDNMGFRLAQALRVRARGWPQEAQLRVRFIG
jgi:Sulfatase-modifying factor enzyme 1